MLVLIKLIRAMKVNNYLKWEIEIKVFESSIIKMRDQCSTEKNICYNKSLPVHNWQIF